MIYLRVTREPSNLEATPGSLAWSVDGLDWGDPAKAWMPSAFTLEDVVRETVHQRVDEWKVRGKTAIPLGIYDVVVTESKRFSAQAGLPVLLPLLLNVPGFDGVRIHGGNKATDTDGCILVAWNRLGPSYIQGSAAADVVRLIQKHGDAKIQILGPYTNR